MNPELRLLRTSTEIFSLISLRAHSQKSPSKASVGSYLDLNFHNHCHRTFSMIFFCSSNMSVTPASFLILNSETKDESMMVRNLILAEQFCFSNSNFCVFRFASHVRRIKKQDVSGFVSTKANSSIGILLRALYCSCSLLNVLNMYNQISLLLWIDQFFLLFLSDCGICLMWFMYVSQSHSHWSSLLFSLQY